MNPDERVELFCLFKAALRRVVRFRKGKAVICHVNRSLWSAMVVIIIREMQSMGSGEEFLALDRKPKSTCWKMPSVSVRREMCEQPLNFTEMLKFGNSVVVPAPPLPAIG